MDVILLYMTCETWTVCVYQFEERMRGILFLFMVAITSCLVIFISPSSEAGD